MKKIMRLCQKSGWLSKGACRIVTTEVVAFIKPAGRHASPISHSGGGGLRLKAHFEWLRTIMNI